MLIISSAQRSTSLDSGINNVNAITFPVKVIKKRISLFTRLGPTNSERPMDAGISANTESASTRADPRPQIGSTAIIDTWSSRKRGGTRGTVRGREDAVKR